MNTGGQPSCDTHSTARRDGLAVDDLAVEQVADDQDRLELLLDREATARHRRSRCSARRCSASAAGSHVNGRPRWRSESWRKRRDLMRRNATRGWGQGQGQAASRRHLATSARHGTLPDHDRSVRPLHPLRAHLGHRPLQPAVPVLHARRLPRRRAAGRHPLATRRSRPSPRRWSAWACRKFRLTGGEPLVRRDLEHAGGAPGRVPRGRGPGAVDQRRAPARQGAGAEGRRPQARQRLARHADPATFKTISVNASLEAGARRHRRRRGGRASPRSSSTWSS